VVAPDRQFFERIEVDGAQFPAGARSRVFLLSGDCWAIGRASQSRGIVPDIDLAAPPADTAVSHRHAELRRHADGGWALIDCGSANGTYLNDDPEPLPSGQLVPISNGDRIHVGAWTTIDVRVRR
jgi:pSer/pThr/pTyr-binding forkhead associated (FHA) protein